MPQILRITRSSPALVRMANSFLGGAATPVRSARHRVTRAEIAALFSKELGYTERDLRNGL